MPAKPRSLIQLVTLLLWRRPVILLLLLGCAFCQGIFFKLSVDHYWYNQAQNISSLSVFNAIIIPLAGLTLALQLAIILLSQSLLTPQWRACGQAILLQQSPRSAPSLFLALFIPTALLTLLPFIIFSAQVFLLSLYSQLDGARLALLLAGILITWFSCLLTAGLISLKCKTSLLSLVLGLFIFALLILLETSAAYWQLSSIWPGIFMPFIVMREGELNLAHLASYLAWCLLILGACYWQLKPHKSSWRLKALILGSFAAYLFAGQIEVVKDTTQDQRNSFSPAIADKILKTGHNLEITAVIDESSSRDEIRRGFHLLKQKAPSTSLKFKSRQSLPPEQQHAGEYLAFTLGDLNQLVSYPFERPVKLAFEHSLKQMLNRKQQWLNFLEGHGEASLFGKRSSDLTQLHQLLKSAGWPITLQNLTQQTFIADNTQLLVVASSTSQWLASEEQQVIDYLKKGGSLLLLCDPGSFVPESLRELLGFSLTPGTLVDWSGYQSGTPHPAVVIINQLGGHPTVKSIQTLLAFPWAQGLALQADTNQLGLQGEVLLQTQSKVWNELNIDQSQLALDSPGEIEQAHAIGLSWSSDQSSQKIIVLGDSHFASDSAIANYGNSQFALNLFSWLTQNALDSANPNHPNLDHSLAFSPVFHSLINWGFSLALPLLILLMWWRSTLKSKKIMKTK